MDGHTGFCSSILGTDTFEQGAAQIKNLYSQNQCHTGDRGNYRAMKESCCLANEDEWQKAADWQFKIKNWPYVNAEDIAVKECFYRMDKTSPENLLKNFAYSRIMQSVALLVGFSLLTTAI